MAVNTEQRYEWTEKWSYQMCAKYDLKDNTNTDHRGLHAEQNALNGWSPAFA